jgi:hypothetical protein
MELVTVRELFKNREQYLDKKVTVGGWIRSIRDSKTFGFIVVNDGSYFEPLQIVYHDEMENFAEVSKLNVGAAIIVKGTLVATPQAKQPFEIQADEVQDHETCQSSGVAEMNINIPALEFPERTQVVLDTEAVIAKVLASGPILFGSNDGDAYKKRRPCMQQPCDERITLVLRVRQSLPQMPPKTIWANGRPETSLMNASTVM